MKLDMSKLNQNVTRKKAVYPTKKTMNLYYKEDLSTKSATAALYILFLCVVLLALAKLLIFDVMVELNDKRDQLDQSQRELASYEEQLADYDKVLLEYERYAATPDEAVTDRMKLLNLIDKTVRSTAKVDSIEINGEEMLLQFSGVTLKQTARIVQALEESPLVSSTQVNTAATTEGGRDVVRANVLIQLTGVESDGDTGVTGDNAGGAGTGNAAGGTENGDSAGGTEGGGQ